MFITFIKVKVIYVYYCNKSQGYLRIIRPYRSRLSMFTTVKKGKVKVITTIQFKVIYVCYYDISKCYLCLLFLYRTYLCLF